MVACVTALYITSKGKAKWRKGLLWLAMVGSIAAHGLFALAAVCALGISVVSLLRTKHDGTRPHQSQVECLWDIRLGSSRADVLFAKGQPYETRKGTWWFDDGLPLYRVSFQGDSVRLVGFGITETFALSEPFRELIADIEGVRPGNSTEQVFAVFGTPSHISESPDHLRRTYSYDRNHVFFTLERDAVVWLGIYDPAFGPVEHNSFGSVAPGRLAKILAEAQARGLLRQAASDGQR